MTPRTLLEINTNGEICLGEHECDDDEIFVGTKGCAVGCNEGVCCLEKENGVIPGKTPSKCADEVNGETEPCAEDERLVGILDCLLPDNCEPADCCMTDEELNAANLLKRCGDQENQGECEQGETFDSELKCTFPCLDPTECCVVTKEKCGDQENQGECEQGETFDSELKCTPPCLDPTECCVVTKEKCGDQANQGECEQGETFDGELKCTPPCLDPTECCVTEARRLEQRLEAAGEVQNESESETEER
jgi:hypothetical protein